MIPLEGQRRLKLKEEKRAYQKAYRKTDKYKAYQKAYRKIDKYKAYQKAYQKMKYHTKNPNARYYKKEGV